MNKIPEPPAWLDCVLSVLAIATAALMFLLELFGGESDGAMVLALIACGISFANSYELKKRV